MTVLVGKKAPDFTAAAVLGNGDIIPAFNLAEATRDKYVILFFYPLNFTFVCPSELIALDNRAKEFKARNTEIIAVSVDSQFSHNAWRKTEVINGGIGAVNYPMIADISHKICQAYGVEHPDAPVAMRGTFLIDRDGMVRSQIVNDLPLGRNIDELLRLVDALQFHEKHGEVCPANWEKGKTAIQPNEKGIADYLSAEAGSL